MATTKKGSIILPVQTLNLGAIPNKPKPKKIFFQFDVKVARNGNKTFSLVAYPAYRIDGKWKIGKKILLPVKKGKQHELQLPLTLGNLELKYSKIERWIRPGIRKITLTPHKYEANPHTEYIVSDGLNALNLTAKPSPPAPPEA